MSIETKIILTGRIPSKKNSKMMLFRGRRPTIISSKEHQQWEKEALRQIKKHRVYRIPSIKTVILNFYFPDHRKCDLTNKAESVMDVLVKANVLEDDSWQIIPSILLSGEYDKQNPRVEIIIKHMSKDNHAQ